MAKASDPKAGAFDADKTGLMSGLLAEEDEFDRRSLWRTGSWGFAAVGAVVLAVTANQWSLGLRREQVAASDLARQAQQIQSLTRESQNETRRLAAAIDTLNGDRDRLFARITVIEQGLDSVTGAIAKQNAAAAAAQPKPAPVASAMPAMMTPPATTPAENAPPAAASTPLQTAAPSVAPATAVAATMPPSDKPRAEVAKPDPAPAATQAALPQIASSKPATPATPPPATTTTAAAPASAPQASPKSMMGPPDPAAPKLVEPAKELMKDPIREPAKSASAALAAVPASSPAQPPAAEAPDKPKDHSKDSSKDKPKDQDKPVLDADAAKATIQRTEFAVDLGTANSIGGLRALWRGLLKSNNAELAELRPIIVLREGNTGLGMQLRLAAGPLHDAAEAAKICAALVESERTCETTVFDGQRLATTAEEAQPAAATKPSGSGRSQSYKRYAPRHSKKDDPPPPPPKQESSTFSSLFGGKR